MGSDFFSNDEPSSLIDVGNITKLNVVDNNKLSDLFGEDGNLIDAIKDGLPDYYDDVFSMIKSNLNYFVDINHTNEKATLKFQLLKENDGYGYLWKKIGEVFGRGQSVPTKTNQSKPTNTEQKPAEIDQSVISGSTAYTVKHNYSKWDNIFSNFVTSYITEVSLPKIYNNIEQKTGKTKKIIYKNFKNNAHVAMGINNDDTLKILYSIFVWVYGDSISKLKLSNTIKKEEVYKLFPAPLSKQYQIPDYTNQIYRSVDYERLKTLFTESKQILVIIHNEVNLVGGKEEEDKMIGGATIKLTDDNKIVLVNDDGKFDSYFTTDAFYIHDVEKQAYYFVRPIETNAGNNKITIAMTSDSEPKMLERLRPGQIKVKYAKTFGKKYDFKSDHPTRLSKGRDFLSKVSNKIKKVGLEAGIDKTFKTIAGTKLSGIAGDFSKMILALIDKDGDPQTILANDVGNHIRFNILNMFRLYMVYKHKKPSMNKVETMATAADLAKYINNFDEFTRWLFEVVNFVMSELYHDNPETREFNYNNVLEYIKERKFFEGGALEDVAVTESYYRNIITIMEKIDYTIMVEERKKKKDPKAKEIIGIDGDNSVAEDFCYYLSSIKVIKK